MSTSTHLPAYPLQTSTMNISRVISRSVLMTLLREPFFNTRVMSDITSPQRQDIFLIVHL